MIFKGVLGTKCPRNGFTGGFAATTLDSRQNHAGMTEGEDHAGMTGKGCRSVRGQNLLAQMQFCAKLKEKPNGFSLLFSCLTVRQ